ncbi:MAG: hypothetical protein PT977_11410 [Acidobacteriota bacterium]|nr:hypothetical protein [Acidobacteriota bacterium]
MRLALFVVAAALTSATLTGPAGSALAQTQAPRPVEALPDVARLTPAEVAFIHPLTRPLDDAPKLAERANPLDLVTRQPLVFTARLLETGKVAEAFVVESPLKALATPLPALVPRWRFTPAKKGGQPVATWMTYSIELAVSLEKAVFTAFTLEPVRKDDPLVAVVPDATGDAWMARYGREIDPKDASAVSIEDVDVLPVPEKTPWSLDAARTRAHVTALLEVSEQGTVGRFLPTGETEPLLGLWLKQYAAKWRFTPAMAGGRPVSCWMTLDATLDYTLDSAKKKSERVVKKNLRSVPK